MGPGAAAGREAAAAALRDLGRPAAAVAPADEAAAPALARAGLVALVEHAPDGAPVVDLDGVDDPLAAILAAADHPREVARRPIFVVGPARSGTTWVLDLLAGHPEVAGVFESFLFMPDELPRLADPGGFDADRGRPVFDRPQGPGQLVSRDEAVAALRARTVSWLARAVGPEHRWLVEKTPYHGQTASIIAEAFPAARFVLVVRDPRDVVVSGRDARTTWLRSPRHRQTLLRKPVPWYLGRRWANIVAHVDALAARRPGAVFELRYEELHADTARVARGLFAFCGISIDDERLRDIVADNDIARRADRGPGRFRRAGRTGDWHRELGRLDRILVEAAAGTAMAERGYLPRPGVPARVTTWLRRRFG